MALLGVRWAPLNTPLQRRLQTLAVAAWFVVLVFGPIIGFALSAYLILCTGYWWLAIAYLVYIYFDESCLTGSRWLVCSWGQGPGPGAWGSHEGALNVLGGEGGGLIWTGHH